MKCLDEIICEAKCCSTEYAAKFAEDKTFGRDTDNSDYFMLMMYIDVLQRNTPSFIKLKAKVTTCPKKISFSSLKKENNKLFLDIREAVKCVDVKLDACLSDAELCKIIEEIKVLCNQCECNCN
jgi:hypothetical protein